MATYEEKISAMLSDTTKHIEFHGYLTNHLKHAVIALHGLGADTQHIENFCDEYARNTYGFGLEAAKGGDAIVTDENWRKYLGKHEQFDSLRFYFEKQADKLGVDAMLRKYVPGLIDGCVGALLHAVIHLGWAIGAGHRGMIIEGVAYLVFSHVTCHPDRVTSPPTSSAARSAMDALLLACNTWDTQELSSWVDATTANDVREPDDIHRILAGTGAQLKIAQVLEEGHPLIDTVPTWMDTLSEKEIWRQLYEAVTLLYHSAPGDFVVLHVITSLHGVRHIAGKLHKEDRMRAIRCYWKALMAVSLALKRIPKESKLHELKKRYDEEVDEKGDTEIRKYWASLFERAVMDSEEHNAKLVFVMHRAWEEFGHRSLFREAARHFTNTPVIASSGAYTE